MSVSSCPDALFARPDRLTPDLFGMGCRRGSSELFISSKLLIKKKLQNRLYISRDSYNVVLIQTSLFLRFLGLNLMGKQTFNSFVSYKKIVLVVYCR